MPSVNEEMHLLQTVFKIDAINLRAAFYAGAVFFFVILLEGTNNADTITVNTTITIGYQIVKL